LINMAKFYQLSREERIAQLQRSGQLNETAARLLRTAPLLPAATAAHLTENQLGQFPLPLGVVHQLSVNGITREVAIVGEEPSVVAAASNGARMASLGSGVTAQAPQMHLVTAEIVYADLATDAAQRIQAAQPDLLRCAQMAHPSIVRRGGGVQSVRTMEQGQFTTVFVDVDVQEAMGANIVNTIAEAMADRLDQLLAAHRLFAVLSNYSEQLTQARVDLPLAAVATTAGNGAAVAQRIELASRYAESSTARATTSNKGVMNGIAGAAIALGNDYRALEAGVHAYAGRGAGYAPLTRWRVEGTQLRGTISLPLQVGTVGGAISALPLARVSRELGHIESVRDEQEVLAALGLVQNLAALRALVGPGIQAGHMALQAGALAIAAGASGAEVDALTSLLQNSAKTLGNAQQLLKQLRHEEEAK
jgi:hydroxymethylglutaryl-CoA reductase